MVTERLLQFGIKAIKPWHRKVVLQFGIRAIKPWHRKVVLQFGIKGKVSTLNLDGLVEWSLDRGCEEKLCLEDQFRTLE
jgi:hypothetical protein